MKSLVKGFLIAAAMLSFAVAANAEEAPASPVPTTESISMSFNYGDNTFTVTDNTAKASETELTVMLVKGDYTGDKSLADIKSDDICYIGQAGGLSYSSLFTNLGVKYTGGKFVPGEYTLVKSGAGMTEASKTKIFLGNAVTADGGISEYMHEKFKNWGVTFGTMKQTIKVYETEENEKYIYVGEGIFPIGGAIPTDNLGFAVQKHDGTSLKKGYRALNTFEALKNIASLNGTNLSVGIQINDVPNSTEIVAIPYVLTSASEAAAE